MVADGVKLIYYSLFMIYWWFVDLLRKIRFAFRLIGILIFYIVFDIFSGLRAFRFLLLFFELQEIFERGDHNIGVDDIFGDVEFQRELD